MKRVLMLTALVMFPLLVGGRLVGKTEPTDDEEKPTAPISKGVNDVVELLKELKTNIEKDGQAEKESYDKYDQWAQDTISRKTSDIEKAEQRIEELTQLIYKLAAEIATHKTEIAQLLKDIAENVDSQRTATDRREREHAEYLKNNAEALDAIASLEAAIKALTVDFKTKDGWKGYEYGSGATEGNYDLVTAKEHGSEERTVGVNRDTSGEKMELGLTGVGSEMGKTVRTARLMSIASSVRPLLSKSAVMSSISEYDLDRIKKFVSQPEAYVSGRQGFLSATQVGNNPFGDYHSHSKQIVGILESMLDAFKNDVKKDAAEEEERKSTYDELMKAKKKEQETLEGSLQNHKTFLAKKTKTHSDSKVEKSETIAQKKADEEFLYATKVASEEKAAEWDERSKQREKELTGLQEAIDMLSNEKAVQTFKDAESASFVQLTSMTSSSSRSMAYQRLRSLASRFQNLDIAQIAVSAQHDRAFDKVITMIDRMIANLRQEEQDDIAHRDRCENDQNANTNELEDINKKIKANEKSINDMKKEKGEKAEELKKIQGEIATTNENLNKTLEARNAEVAAFRKSLSDDNNAIDLLKKAIHKLTIVHNEGQVPLIQTANGTENGTDGEPGYKQDEDRAPEVKWNKEYSSRRSETHGVIEILKMIVEDLKNEMKTARTDNEKAQGKYEEVRGALLKTLEAQNKRRISTEKRIAELDQSIAATEGEKQANGADKDSQDSLKKALLQDCSWVKTHFQTRRDKRKDEIQGLIDAKGILAGASPDAV